MPVRFKFNVGGQITISVSQLFHYVGHNIESIAIVSVFAQYISLSLSLSLSIHLQVTSLNSYSHLCKSFNEGECRELKNKQSQENFSQHKTAR